MSFEKVDRLPIVEWAPYCSKTVDRWHNEGLPEDLTDSADIRAHFNFDRYLQLYVFPRGTECPRSATHGGNIISDEKDYDNIKKHLYTEVTFDKDMLKSWAKEQKKGGFMVSVDHQTPPEVSIDHYHLFMELLNKYCQTAAQQ